MIGLYMTIGALASKADIPASTIRYWERIGILSKPARSGGQRRYLPEAVHQIAVLRLAQACGFRLEEMRHLLHGFRPGVSVSRRWEEMVKHKQCEIDEQIKQLRGMQRLLNRVRQCKCADLTECGRIAVPLMRKTTK